MSVDIDVTKDYTPINSIVGSVSDYTSSDLDDKYQPLTYIEWLSRISKQTSGSNDLTFHYNSYLREWASIKQVERDTTSIITSQYRTLIKDIALNYTTDEEKRFLANINYKDPRHVESALPFFAAKIKQITLYYARERDIIKQQKVRRSSSGSIEGIERSVAGEITHQIVAPSLHNLRSGNIDAGTHESEAIDYNVKLVELYDLSQSYFKDDIIPISIETFAGIDSIIANTLEECAPVLKISDSINIILTNQSTLQVESSKTLESLNHSEFFNYIKTEDNLNDIKIPDYVNTILGADVMQLSGGNVTKLSDVTKPWRNIYNRYHPVINSTPESSDSYKTIEEIGGYNVPSKQKLLTFYSKSPQPIYLSNESPELLPDTSRFGNSVFSGVTGLPVRHEEDITWLKADNSNGRLFGDIVKSKNLAKFSGYTSTDEITIVPQVGLSRSTDDLDFFTGPRKSKWSQSDIFPEEGPNVYNLDKRIDTLIIGDRTLYKWRTDIHGNEYALYKTIQKPRSPLAFGPGVGDDEFETVVGCQLLDGGDTLAERPDMYASGVEYDIYEGGRSPGIDNKYEQSRVPRPFRDLRRKLGVDEFGEVIYEEHNSYYVGVDPEPSRASNIVELRPITYHGFKATPVYDSQAYGGLFTDTACGVIDPSSFKCEVIDSYSFNDPSEEILDGLYISNHNPLTGDTQDSYEQYINPGFSEEWEELGFDGSSSENEIIQGSNIDGSLFSDTFCENQAGDYIYDTNQAPYYDQDLTVSRTKHSTVPDTEIDTTPTIYDQKTNIPGEMFFRSYNGSKIDRIQVTMSNILRNFGFFDSSDHDVILDDITNSNIIDMDVLYDNILISTPSHLLIEKINFDDTTSTLLPNNTTNVLLRTNNGDDLEKSLGWFFNEDSHQLVTGFTSVSGSVVYPRIYTVDLKTLQYRQSFPNNDYPESINSFSLTDELSGYVVESIDAPIIKYNDKTDTYNVSYSSMLSGVHDEIYAVFTNNFKYDKLNMRLIDACVYHGDNVTKYTQPGEVWEDPVVSRTIRLEGGDELIPTTTGEVKTQTLSLSSMIGYSLSGYQLELEINTKFIPVSGTGFNLAQILYDPADGSDIYVNDRVIDDGLNALTVDITELPDQSDFGDPRVFGFNHLYRFDKPTEHTYSSTISAVYSDFSMIIYTLNIETVPYSVQSGLGGLKLIESKLYTDVTGANKQLLVLETQSPRYISNVVIDR